MHNQTLMIKNILEMNMNQSVHTITGRIRHDNLDESICDLCAKVSNEFKIQLDHAH